MSKADGMIAGFRPERVEHKKLGSICRKVKTIR